MEILAVESHLLINFHCLATLPPTIRIGIVAGVRSELLSTKVEIQ